MPALVPAVNAPFNDPVVIPGALLTPHLTGDEVGIYGVPAMEALVDVRFSVDSPCSGAVTVKFDGKVLGRVNTSEAGCTVFSVDSMKDSGEDRVVSIESDVAMPELEASVVILTASPVIPGA